MNRVSRGSAVCLAATVFTLAMLTGCTGSKTGSGDTTKPQDTTSIADDDDDPTPENGGYPTDGKTAEWREYVTKRLNFNLEFAELDSTAVLTYSCKTGDVCFPGVVRFLVVPEKKVFNAKWEDAMKVGSNKGFVAAAYWNIDRVAVKSLNLPRDARLYQWVGPVSDSAVGILLFSVTDSVRIAGRADGYRFCPEEHPHKKATARKRAAFVCPRKDGVTTSSAALSSGVALFPEDLWISCAGGCCQSSLIQ